MATYVEFGRSLAGWRTSAGFPQQADLAQRIGAAQQTISRWERGESRPRVTQIPALASALGVDSDEVLAAAGYAPQKLVTVSFDKPFPLEALDEESFEKFSATLLEHRYPDATVHRLGSKGHTQEGADVEVKFPEGHVWDFQCKREQEFGPQKVHTAVGKYKRTAGKKIILLARIASPQARQAIDCHNDWEIWDKDDISRHVRQLTKDNQRRIVDIFFPHLRFALLGETDPSPWMSTEEFFAPFLGKKGAFGHDWELVGREQEFHQLCDYLEQPEVKIIRLIGAGGFGKTRLLREAVKKFKARRKGVLIRFLSVAEEPTSKSLDSLGDDEKLLIIDDCHDRSDLSLVLQYAADPQHRTRLLLASRPYGADLIQHQASRFGIVDKKTVDVHLQPLGLKDSIALAHQVLRDRNGPATAAEPIAKITLDCPLSTVMASLVVSSDHRHVELVKNAKAFRDTLVASFYKVAAGSIGAKSDEAAIRKLLRVFALVQPLNIEDTRLLETVENLEGIERNETARLIRVIIDGGVLFKRGGLYRLSPDLLADAIIERECVAAEGRSTGYAERVFDAVDNSPSLERLIVNLGRLDWRRSDGNPSQSKLLDGVWDKLKPQYEYHDPHLKAVEAVAFYQPMRALSLATKLIRERRFSRHVAEILRFVAYNLEHVTPACECLWELATRDDRETNPHPEHPIRILSELCEVKPDKPRAFIEAVAKFGFSLLEKPDSWSHKYTPFDFLKSIFEPDGHVTSWGGRSMTLEQFSVNLTFVRPIRSKLIRATLSLLARSDLPRAGFLAARLLHEALRYPRNSLSRVEWDREFSETMAKLAALIRTKNLSPVVLLEIADAVSWHAHYGDGTPAIGAKKLFSVLPSTIEFRTTRVLVDGYGHLLKKMSDNVSDDHESNSKEQENLSIELTEAYPSGDELRAFVNTMLQDIARHSDDVDSAPRPFLVVLCRKNPKFAEAIVRHVASAPSEDVIDRHVDIALSELMVEEPAKARDAVENFLASDDPKKQSAVGYAYCFSPATRSFGNEAVEHVRKLLASEQPHVVASGIAALRGMIHEPRTVLDLVVSGNISVTANIADQALMLLRFDRVNMFESLTDEDVKRLLSKLEVLKELEGHWIEEFLAEASKQHGLECVEFFIRRVDHAAKVVSWDFRPCNHGPYGHIPLKFRQSDDFPKILSRVVTWLFERTTDDLIFRTRSAELFGTIFTPFDDQLVGVLRHLSNTANQHELEAIGRIIGEGPASVVLKDQEFVIHLLTRSRQFGEECYRRVISYLYGAAISGMRSGSPGQPFKRDVDMLEDAEKALSTISRFSAGYEFYEGLAKYARDAIDLKRREDERLDDI
ncbi:XRE family transcriptional regulator [Hyphomicrobium facile]|uniref:ATPase n=1 Tax=Hyphomicrobium facile TaxID=51670 RepID=A0A1I7NE63_9HYPH|nr:XRE family transcriptional regulator [Hyphomicrobium facile]SFV32950.1 ATPase [Hyphomicrobium facile]